MNSGKNIIHKNIYLLSLTRIIFVMLMQLPFCVYILFSEKDNLLYTGFSTNLEHRIKNHNDGGTKSTAYRRPLKLIFCEFYLYEEDARKREKYFKTTMGKKAIKLMLAGTLTKLGYKNYGSPKIEIVYENPEAEKP